jgi:hypothetical protein
VLLVGDEYPMRDEEVGAQKHVRHLKIHVREAQLGVLYFLAIADLEARERADVTGLTTSTPLVVPASTTPGESGLILHAPQALKDSSEVNALVSNATRILLAIDVRPADGVRMEWVDSINVHVREKVDRAAANRPGVHARSHPCGKA